MSGPRALLYPVLVAAVLVAGCHGPAAVRGARLVASGPAWRVGTEVVVAEYEGRPEGVVTRRQRWRLVEVDSAMGRFEGRRDGDPADREPRSEWVPFRAGVPTGRLGAAARGRMYGGGVDPRPVDVPAGRFRCWSTVRSYEESDGPMMRVDEWWAPGVPVAVQRWVRWEGIVDSIGGPPRDPRDLHVGTRWAVLESIHRP